MTQRDFIVGDRRGYVLRGRRIVIEIGCTDHSMTIADAVSLSTLLDLLLRDAGARPAVWMHVLAHNLAWAASLCRAFALGEYFERDTAVGGWRLDLRWAPGCGREAP